MIIKNKIEPVFKAKAVPFVFAVNDSYCPIVSVMIQSIIDCSSKENYYDIIILNRDISTPNMDKLSSMTKDLDNFSIRFVNVASMIEEYDFFVGGKSDFTIDAYLRLLIPYVLSESYHKAIYMDGDMIAIEDVAQLMNVDVSGYLLAACRDTSGLGAYYDKSHNRKNYRDNILHLVNPDDYFISGLLVMNLDEFRRKYTSKWLLEFAASRDWIQHDQDVLNVLCNGGRAKIIHLQWNLLKMNRENLLPEVCYQEWMEACENPKIVHFGGAEKPWKRDDAIFFDEFWKTAMRSPYYFELIHSVVQDVFEDKKRIKALENKTVKYQKEIVFLKDSLESVKKENSDIKNRLSHKEKEYNALKRKLSCVQRDFTNIKQGLSFRIGRIITWLPRVILGRK